VFIGIVRKKNFTHNKARGKSRGAMNYERESKWNTQWEGRVSGMGRKE